MSNQNPTALRIGMSGLIEGRRYTVLGRVVLGVVLDGETYYWNEFYLGEREGRVATLVYEKTEEGPTWKVFRKVEGEPVPALAEAAAKRVGDVIKLKNLTATIDLVGTSKVYAIEGDAPAGTSVGEIDQYFNASAGKQMIVASWKGAEIEYYRGRNLFSGQAEAGFGLPPPRQGISLAGLLPAWGSLISAENIKGVLGIAALVLWIFLNFDWNSQQYEPPKDPPPKLAAPPTRLPAGATGVLNGRKYSIAAYAMVEISQPGKVYREHEYALSDEQGGRARLIQGFDGNAAAWLLLVEEPAFAEFAPLDAATKRPGSGFKFKDQAFQVATLHAVKLLHSSGAAAVDSWPGQEQYGLFARNGETGVLLRWSEQNLQMFRGTRIQESMIRGAFGGAL